MTHRSSGSRIENLVDEFAPALVEAMQKATSDTFTEVFQEVEQYDQSYWDAMQEEIAKRIADYTNRLIQSIRDQVVSIPGIENGLAQLEQKRMIVDIPHNAPTEELERRVNALQHELGTAVSLRAQLLDKRTQALLRARVERESARRQRQLEDFRASIAQLPMEKARDLLRRVEALEERLRSPSFLETSQT